MLGPESLKPLGPWLADSKQPWDPASLCIPSVSFPQAHHQQAAATAQLEQLRQDAERQEETLARAVLEKEALVRERAALGVRLQAVERDRQDLTEQVLGLR